MNRVADSMDAQGLAEFLAEAARVRTSGVLGRSQQMQRLFDFLVECRRSGRVPKEIEVAIDCFERGPDVDSSQDATVRVTAHKLRRRLEEFYRDAGEPPRLTIPRGEYRLALQPPAEAEVVPVAQEIPPVWRRLVPATRREAIALGVAAAAVLVAILALVLPSRDVSPQGARLAEARTSVLWSALLADDLPIQLVLGDYYIFGERDERGQIQRLVREFDINSRRELEQVLVERPDRAARFADMNLSYLPTGSAQALREVLPLVVASGKPVMLTLASELDPASLKSTHVVYLGYLSALGMLEDLVLNASLYSVGGSYDELIDSESGQALISEAGELHPAGKRYRDYGYVASLTGPGNHAHLVIAGMRDVGLMQAAEAAADPARLRELTARVPQGPFEALYEVGGLNGINVESRLLEARQLP